MRIKKIAAAAAIVAAASMATAVAGTAAFAGTSGRDATAAAVPIYEYLYLEVSSPEPGPGLVVDISGGSVVNRGEAIQWSRNGGWNQQWILAPDGRGRYEIVNRNSSKCLSTDLANGDQLYQYTCLNLPSQLWTIAEVGDGTVKIRNNASSRANDLYVGIDRYATKPGAAIVGRKVDARHPVQTFVLAPV